MPLVVAAFAIALGLVLCCAGYRLYRILLPIFAFFAGLWLAGAVMSALFGQGFLANLISIVAGLGLGVVFAILSYLFWYVAFAIAGGFMGYWLFASIWQAIDLETGFIMTVLGIGVGIIFALAFLLFNAQRYVLIVVTALTGAGLAVNGVLLLFGNIQVDQLKEGAFVPLLQGSILWTLAWLALFAVGLLAQLRVSRGYALSVKEW